MTTPNPLAPVKGARTTLWMYSGLGNAYANPGSDVDWVRLAQVKDLTPAELTADSYDDSYLDDDDADWASTTQGQKSAGEASFTLAWKPREVGQKALVSWFDDGSDKAYKIKYPNGVVDVFTGWVSSLGKAVAANEVITRTVKIANKGKPQLAEDTVSIIAVTGVTVLPTSVDIAIGASGTVQVTILPADASDSSFIATSSDPTIATVTVSGTTLTVAGVTAGNASVVVMTSSGQKVAIIPVNVS